MRIYAILCKNIHMFKKFLLCLLLLCLTSCQDKSDKASDIIKIGTSPDYPPFEYKKDGEIVGFDIALVKEIAKILNKTIEIHELDFASLVPALQAKKVDLVISGLTLNPERAENIDFSDIYYRAKIVAITKKSLTLSSEADLASKRIGAQLGSIMLNFAEQQKNNFANITISSLANNLHLLQELKLDRIDVLLLEEAQKDEILAANPELTAHVFEKTGDGYAIGLIKNSPLKQEVNEAIEELRENGTIIRLEEAYFAKGTSSNSSLWKALTYISAGIIVTLKYALISVFFGLIIGIILSLCRLSSIKFLKFFAEAYLSVFRGTPLLLQLSVMYFALPALLNVKISAFAAGIIAFSMNSGAYVSENIRAGIESVDKGQFEAAKSLGMPYRTMMQYIILPQAIRNILPSLVNEAINLIKESSIISTIGEADIMRRANVIAAEQYSYLKPLLLAALCYYIVVTILSALAKILEKRLKKL